MVKKTKGIHFGTADLEDATQQSFQGTRNLTLQTSHPMKRKEYGLLP